MSAEVARKGRRLEATQVKPVSVTCLLGEMTPNLLLILSFFFSKEPCCLATDPSLLSSDELQC